MLSSTVIARSLSQKINPLSQAHTSTHDLNSSADSHRVELPNSPLSFPFSGTVEIFQGHLKNKIGIGRNGTGDLISIGQFPGNEKVS